MGVGSSQHRFFWLMVEHTYPTAITLTQRRFIGYNNGDCWIQALQHGIALRVTKDNAGTTIFNRIQQLFTGAPTVNRHRNCSSLNRSHTGNHPRRTVAHGDCHTIPFAYCQILLQCSRNFIRFFIKLMIGVTLTLPAHKRLIAMFTTCLQCIN